MVDILIPLAKRVTISLPTIGLPPSFWGQLAGSFGRGALPVGEIGMAFGGRDAMPTKPIMVYGPDSHVMTMVVGAGVTEAAELEDLAAAAVEQQEDRLRQQWRDEQRERQGLVAREKLEATVRQAFADRAEHQRRNPSEYHVPPPPDQSWIKALPEFELTDEAKQEMQQWLP